MSPEAFRRIGYRAVDRIAAYMEQLDGLAPMPKTAPGEVMARVPECAADPPGDVDEWDSIFEDLEQFIEPNLMHWQSPGFFGYFPCNSSGPAIIGELLSAGYGQQGMLWQTSPASNELERALLDQMARACGLPDRFVSTSPNGGGCIQGTASESTLVAMVAGRRRVVDQGADPARVTVYASKETHSSFVKAAMISGLAISPADERRVRLIAVDSTGAMDALALREAIVRDMDAGCTPAMVTATLGTTGTTAIDPLDAIGRVIEETGAASRGCWLHVDAAHAGAMLVCPEHRGMLAGIERVDSFCFNPHKWLLVNFDCNLFWTADRGALVNSLSVTPEYLRNEASEGGEVFDYRDWSVPLGRRFRSLKLWLVLRHYGLAGLRAHIRGHLRLAALFEGWVRSDERFEVLSPRRMNLVCLALKAGDAPTRELMDRVNRSGRIVVTHTVISTEAGPRLAIRVAIGATTTEQRHVREAWAKFAEVADDLVGGVGS
ncbi:MAG TPA: aspartate aminotransferase family protein [Phycisphaerales bacterium]|nr:aspartate aminotransferase family protein [Phycisphaerales bacterium]